MDSLPFAEVWLVDFEYQALEGEHPEPVCLVALEWRTRRRHRLWWDQMGASPPYDISSDSLFVSFASDAEMSCHLAMDWKLPARVLDLRIEFLQAINVTPRPARGKGEKERWGSLLHALNYYGLDSMGGVEKEQMREVILRGGPTLNAERGKILDYCEADVLALCRLLPAMIRRGHIHLDRRLHFALHRGRFMRAVTRMQRQGVPIDVNRFNRLIAQWDSIKLQLIETLGKPYGVYDAEGHFSHKLFATYLSKRLWLWPTTKTGRLDMQEKTFKQMAQRHPELENLRQLKYCLEQLKLQNFAVGRDGYARCWLAPFASRTGRNQPSNSRFIFSPAVWIRSCLIQPKPGWGIAYIDWVGQEFGIAAALSNDPEKKKAYQSVDFYVHFGQQAGLIPAGGTGETHSQERELCKVAVLATQYGQSYQSLAEQIGQPDIVAREILARHHKIYHRFWSWSDNRVSRYLLNGQQQTVFGWTHYFKGRPKINSIRNFDMQGNASEMLRVACCLGTENGIAICAPIHDAVLITAPLDRLDEDVERMRSYMAEASRIVLDGFELRTEEHVFRYPEHYF